MSGLKGILQSRVSNAAQHINNSITTVGVVTDSDEMNNTCSVRYVDKDGQKRNRDNVVVRLYGSGTDYFPAKDDTVVIEETGDTCVVIARHVGNYAMDVRSKMKLVKDIFSDSGGSEPGGSII
jgi:hypothetical protein